jgi:hemerythrin-like domain-containing protein
MSTPADTTTLRLVHRALLDGARRLADALEHALEADRRRSLPALARWATGFVDELQRHHAGQDGRGFPRLLERVPAAAPALAELDRDHHELTGLLEALGPAIAAVAGTTPARLPFVPAQQEAARLAGRLATLLAEHITAEEAVVVPLLRAHFSAEEEAAFTAETAALLPVRAATWTVPWLLDGCRADERSAALAAVPPALRLVGLVTRRRYRKLTATAFPPARAQAPLALAA